MPPPIAPDRRRHPPTSHQPAIEPRWTPRPVCYTPPSCHAARLYMMTPQDAIGVDNLFSIKGKTALVTGGSRGIGLMIARGYLEAGAKVYISSRKKEVCDETARQLS